jgi:hypothetical protein
MISQALVATFILATPNGKFLSDHEVTRYSTDIANVAESKGEASFLVLTANFEGSFSRAVEHCKIVGDHGNAITMYQLHKWWWSPYTRDQLCASNALATEQAHMVAQKLYRLVGDWRTVIMKYAGFTTCKSKDCTRRVELFDSLMAIEEP